MTSYYPLIASNPFFDAFSQSDLMGKGIYLCLIAISIVTWTLLIHKAMMTRKARALSANIYQQFETSKQTPLNLDLPISSAQNPLLEIYLVLKRQTLEILNKNRKFGGEKSSFLSTADLDFVEAHASSVVADQTQALEKHLFLLKTIVSLAPFLGLLGTVWGILDTFSELQLQAAGSSHQMLGGLSLALTTTVLGLIIAIPALVGYNWQKAVISDLRTTMESFSNEVIASVELQYRQVDIRS